MAMMMLSLKEKNISWTNVLYTRLALLTCSEGERSGKPSGKTSAPHAERELLGIELEWTQGDLARANMCRKKVLRGSTGIVNQLKHATVERHWGLQDPGAVPQP